MSPFRSAIHRRSRESYGAPMIRAELADDYGIRVVESAWHG